jgi:hypothetical protein
MSRIAFHTAAGEASVEISTARTMRETGLIVTG